jgi:hypothetical protein
MIKTSALMTMIKDVVDRTIAANDATEEVITTAEDDRNMAGMTSTIAAKEEEVTMAMEVGGKAEGMEKMSLDASAEMMTATAAADKGVDMKMNSRTAVGTMKVMEEAKVAGMAVMSHAAAVMTMAMVVKAVLPATGARRADMEVARPTSTRMR